MRCFLLLLLISLHWSCQSHISEIVVNDFPLIDTVNMTEIDVPPVLLASGNVAATDSLLVVSQYKGENLFVFFDLVSGEFKFKKGFQGRGPNEFHSIDRRYISGGSNYFKIRDRVHIKRVMLDENRNLITSTENIIPTDYPINNYMELGDGRICIHTYQDNEKEYRMIDLNTKKETVFSDYPQWVDIPDNDSKQYLFAYVKNSVAKPDGKRFISFYAKFPKFRLYSSSGVLLKEVTVEKSASETMSTDVFNDPFQTYIYPFATNKYIYIICENRRRSDPPNNYTELQIWDWNGDPVSQIFLDKQFDLFTLSLHYKKLYGIHTGVEDKIYVCDFSRFM